MNVLRRHPVAAYFALTFIISWGGLLILGGGFAGAPKTKEEFQSQMHIFIPLALGGPSLSCILLTALVHGKAGFAGLVSRFLKWRVNLGWYAIALLFGPLVILAELLALSYYSTGFLPGVIAAGERLPLLAMGLVAGVMVGFFEELGWTGFATPLLRTRYGVWGTGLIIGALWGGWHIFLNVVWVAGAYMGGLPPILYFGGRGLSDLAGILVAFRILMVLVYDRTGSLLVAMLMHASLTAATIIFEPQTVAGWNLLLYDLASAVAMWLSVAAAIALIGRVAKRGQKN